MNFYFRFRVNFNHMKILRTIWHKCVTYMCYVCMIACMQTHVGTLNSFRIQSITADINTGIRNTVAFTSKLVTKYVNMKQLCYVVSSCLL
jgi:hypothetical protein